MYGLGWHHVFQSPSLRDTYNYRNYNVTYSGMETKIVYAVGCVSMVFVGIYAVIICVVNTLRTNSRNSSVEPMTECGKDINFVNLDKDLRSTWQSFVVIEMDGGDTGSSRCDAISKEHRHADKDAANDDRSDGTAKKQRFDCNFRSSPKGETSAQDGRKQAKGGFRTSTVREDVQRSSRAECQETSPTMRGLRASTSMGNLLTFPVKECLQVSPAKEGHQASPPREGPRESTASDSRQAFTAKEGLQASPLREGPRESTASDSRQTFTAKEGLQASPLREGPHESTAGDSRQTFTAKEGLQASPLREGSRESTAIDSRQTFTAKEGLQASPLREGPHESTASDSRQTFTANEGLQTSPTRDGLQSSTDIEVLQSSTDREVLQASTTRGFLQSSTDREVLQASTDREVLQSSTDREGFQASTTREVVHASTEREVLQASTDREDLQTSSAREYLPASTAMEVLQTSPAREYLPASTAMEDPQIPSDSGFPLSPVATEFLAKKYRSTTVASSFPPIPSKDTSPVHDQRSPPLLLNNFWPENLLNSRQPSQVATVSNSPPYNRPLAQAWNHSEHSTHLLPVSSPVHIV